MDLSSFITKPSQAVEGFHGILYGDPKTGKTSTLDDPNFKVLIFDLEGGTAVLSEAENVDRIAIPDVAKQMNKSEYEALCYLIEAVERGEIKGYDLYAIDSITQFETYVKEFVATKYAPNRKREIKDKFGAQSDWGDLKDLITKTIKWVHTLTKRGDNSIHMLWIAHVGVKEDSITKETVGTKIQLQGKNTAEVVMSIVDGIFYMYNRAVTSEDGKTTTIERGILTKPSGVFKAGVRQSKKKDPLPTVIKDPVWSELFATLGYVKK